MPDNRLKPLYSEEMNAGWNSAFDHEHAGTGVHLKAADERPDTSQSLFRSTSFLYAFYLPYRLLWNGILILTPIFLPASGNEINL